MLTNAETVLLVIRAGLELFSVARKAYVDSTRSMTLTLPLPRMANATVQSARTWFTGSQAGREAAARTPRVAWLLAQARLDTERERELLQIYTVLLAATNPATDDSATAKAAVDSEQLCALLTVRQWSEHEPEAPRTALQQIAGSIVNLAVDYYASMPGAISSHRPEGRALLAFLEALDDVDFAATPAQELAGEMLVGVMDGLAAHPGALGGGRAQDQFVRNIATSLSTSAKDLLADATLERKREAGVWLRLVARAMVEGGAQTVLSNPVRFLGVEEGAESALAGAVSSTLAELLLAEEHRVTFAALLSGGGLTKVAQAALGAVAANPDLLKVDHQGLKAILVAVAGDLAKYDAPFTADLFPELARLVLEKSAANMDLVWGPRFKSADRHLLVTATRSLLRSLAKKPKAGSTWKPTLTQEQLLIVAETVFEEVIDNPDWLVERAAGESDVLGAAVEAMLDSMRRFDGARVSADSGIAMLRAALLAVGKRVELLDRLPQASHEAGAVALTAAVDAVMSAALGDGGNARAKWRLARNSSLEALVVIALEALATHGPSAEHIIRLREVLARLTSGQLEFENFASSLTSELAA
ncbi:MAG: hypothetical protein MUC36_09690 [Planctomycetes bacterium]|jgi:hypothetical protein|nr:hypothetical protein [Planctomycetota bacterium]